MPIIAYISSHGENDYPIHFAFFKSLEERGLLNKYVFALDPMVDYDYCEKLMQRFPQLILTETHSKARKIMRWMSNGIGRGYRPLSFFDKFDGVCLACGGKINEYCLNYDIFRFYPFTRNRAILFHSIEEGALKNPIVRKSVAGCQLVIGRTKGSAIRAKEIGTKWSVESSDIVFNLGPQPYKKDPGYAVALRIPQAFYTQEYIESLKEIIQFFESKSERIDFVKVESPIGEDMIKKYSGSNKPDNINLFYNDTMYDPFMNQRDMIISARFHTTIIALLYGNLNIMQFQIERGTNKTYEFLNDLGLSDLKIHTEHDMNLQCIQNFMSNPISLEKTKVEKALQIAKKKVNVGLDALEEWLMSL